MRLLLHVRARRFSSTAAATPSTATAKDATSRVTRFFKGPALEELPEIQTLEAVQRLTEQAVTSNVSSTLTGAGEHNYRSWLQRYLDQQPHQSTIDKPAFEALLKDVAAHIQSIEVSVLDGVPQISPSTISDEHRDQQDAYLEVLKLRLVRHKCTNVAAHFDHLDDDKDGAIQASELQALIEKVVEGSGDDWIRYQFEVQDTDKDELVNEGEAKAILDAILLTQTAVLTELFSTHVANLPKKKHMKAVENAVNETNWKEKIPEKARCVFHFASKEDDAGKLVHWESFKASQEAEFPELNEMLRVYAKGIYNERYNFYELKQETRSRRIKGVLLALSLAVGDALFAII